VKGMTYYLADIFALLAMAQISCIFLCQGHTLWRHCIQRWNNL